MLKAEAVKQLTERGFAVAKVSKRLGVCSRSMDRWLKKTKSEALAGPARGDDVAIVQASGGVRRLRAKVERPSERRDLLELAAMG
ncbi:TPA: hypothetical protein QEN11_21085 [Stenotrophomonas maltophilia]|nr:hypothetical protein [Stenotrophomonas maltophilia]